MSAPRFIFADEYRAVGFSPTADTVRGRQQAFETIRPTLDNSKILTLVRLFFDLPTLTEATWFRDGFAETDPSFSLIDNSREAAFLAYALLTAALEDGKVVAGLAALTAAAAKNRIPAVCSEFLTRARETLATNAIASRQATVAEPKVNAVVKDLGPVIDQATQANDWAKAGEALKTITKTFNDALVSLARQTQTAVSSLTAELIERREEADMLWWYVGGWSRVFERPFAAFTPATISVLAGFDLASLVRTSLGPASAPAVLYKVIHNTAPQGTTEVTLTDAIDGLAADDLARLTFGNSLKSVPDLCPVATAIAKAQEIGPSPHWHGAFRKSAAMDPAASFAMLDLSVQAFREGLLMKHLA